MGKRRESNKEYLRPEDIPPREDPPSIYEVGLTAPAVIERLDKSMVKQAQQKVDWSLYKVSLMNGNPYILREMCDRCGNVRVPPKWRKIRAVETDYGTFYLEAGLCKDCINASVYVDKYLDGDVLSETEAKKQFYEYAMEYEKAWRVVIAAAPRKLMTEDEWHKRCTFFRGCAFCGGPIETRAKFFPAMLNGTHAPWNVIPLCGDCHRVHMIGRQTKGKAISRYRVFSTSGTFQRYKETRLYLLNMMDKYEIFNEPLRPFRQRFFEVKQIPEEYL